MDPSLISLSPSDQPDISAYIWQRIIPLLKNTVLFNPEKIANHNKAVIEDVVKSS